MAAISVCILLTAISIFVQMPFLGSLEPLRTYQQLACLPGCEVVALVQPQVVLVNGLLIGGFMVRCQSQSVLVVYCKWEY